MMISTHVCTCAYQIIALKIGSPLLSGNHSLPNWPGIVNPDAIHNIMPLLIIIGELAQWVIIGAVRI